MNTPLPGMGKDRFSSPPVREHDAGGITRTEEHPAFYQHPLPSGDDPHHDIAGFSVLHPALSHLQFQHVTNHLADGNGGDYPFEHKVLAYDPHASPHAVGALRWQPDTRIWQGHKPDGEVMAVRTHDDYQRKGLAQAMFDVARSHPATVVQPHHSQERTKEGEVMARKVGGFVPPKSPVKEFGMGPNGRLVDHRVQVGGDVWNAARQHYQRTGTHALTPTGRYKQPKGR